MDCFDPNKRAEEKQDSRNEDTEDLVSGKKSREELRQENGIFSFPDAKIDWSRVGRLS